MKLRKLLAMALVALMVAGMLPTAALAATNQTTTPGTVYQIHEHEWSVRSRTEPTCGKDGNVTYYCFGCDQSKTETLPATGNHSWGEWTVTQAATCAAAGSQTRSCSVCGKTETQSIPATGNHSWDGGSVTTAATCTAAGVRTYTCTVCGATRTEAIPAMGHSFGEWSVTKAATCTAEGVETRTCSQCGATETRAIPKIAHSFGKWRTTREATCAKEGEEERKCSACGLKETRKINKLPHTYGEWTVELEPTCTEKGRRTRACAECGYVDAQAIDMIPHTFGEWTLTREATCTADGEETATCQVCGYGETRAVPMIPHSFGEWKVLTPATCTAEGEQVHACAACGLEEKEKLPMIPHEFGEWNVISELTDWSVGIRERTCSLCGLTEREETQPAGTLKKGDKGDGVKQLQETLNGAGYDSGKPDGIFGGKTEGAVKNYEKDNGKPEDGIGWPGIVPKIMLGGKKLPENLGLEVYLTSVPSWYPANATATFDAELTNTSGLDLDSWTLYQMSGNNAGFTEWKGVASGGFLAAGDTVPITGLEYTVGSTDVEAGDLVVSFYASGSAAGGKALYSNQEDLGLLTQQPGPSILVTADKVIVTDFVADAVVDIPMTLINTSDTPLVLSSIDSIGYYDDVYLTEDWMSGSLEPYTEYHFTMRTKLYSWELGDKYVTRSIEVWCRDPENGLFAPDLAHAFIVPKVEGPSVLLMSDDITGMGGDVGDEVWLPLYAVNNGSVDLYVSEIESGHTNEYADYDMAYDILFPAGDSFPLSFRVVVSASDAHYCSLTNDVYFWRTVFLRAFPTGDGAMVVDTEDEMLWFNGAIPGLKLTMTQTTPGQETWSPDGSGHIADISYSCVVTNSGERPVVLDGLYCHMYPNTEAAYELMDLGDSILLEPGQNYSFTATLPFGTDNITPGSASETIDGLVEADFLVVGLNPDDKQEIASSRSEDNVYTYKIKLDAFGWTPPEPEAEPAEEEPDASMFVAKAVTSRAAIQTGPTESGDYYQEGEEATYEIYFSNWSEETLYDVEVIDSIGGVETVVDTVPSMAPHEDHTTIYHYNVKFSDAVGYMIENHAWTTYRVGDSSDRVKSYDDLAYIRVLNLPVTDGEPSGDLAVTKIHYGNPTASNGNFAEGDYIDYQIKVTNVSGHTIENITVTDPLSGLSQVGPTFSLAPGESQTVSFDYYVTATDVENESIKNVARAEWTEDDGKKYADSNLHAVWTEKPGLNIVKYVANSPLLPGGFQEDEIIHYEITVTNVSPFDMFDLVVRDHMAPGDGVAGTIPSLDPGQSATVGFDYTVTGADVIAGEVVNQATVELNHKNNSGWLEQYVHSNELHTPTVKGPVEIATVKTEETSEGPEGYPLNHTPQGLVAVKNNSDTTIYNVDVYDLPNGDTVGYYLGTIPQIDPSQEKYLPWGMTVTQADVDRGYMTNAARVEFTDPNTGEQRVEPVPEITIKVKQPETVYGGLQVVKTVENLPARGFFVEDEDILFHVEVTNISGQEVHDMTVYDAFVPGGVLASIASLGDGHTTSPLDFYYTVTGLDVSTLTEINNVATVHATGEDGTKYIALSNPAIAPIGIEPIGVVVDCAVTKVETTAPANGSYYVEGETIGYDITVTNSGEVPYDFEAHDTLKLDGPMGGEASFAPSDSRTYHFDYAVEEWDCITGSVVNEAYAVYWLSDGYPLIAWSEPVTSPAGFDAPPEPPTTGAPGEPGKETEPEKKSTDTEPESPVEPDAPDDEGGNSGPTGPDYCRRTLTGVADGAAEFRLDYCVTHMRAAKATAQAIGKAETPEEQLAVWRQATQLWTEALNAEYSELMGKVAPEDRPAVIQERALFYLQLSCRRDALAQAYADDPALAEQRLSEQLMNKCADLCYEVHTAPEARIDSRVTGRYTGFDAPPSGDDCARLVTATDTGATYQEVLCGQHGVTEDAITAMLTDASALKTPEKLWLSARQLWLTELDAATNDRYRAADEAGRKLVAAERVSFGNWLGSREAMLNILYPDNPEIVQEVLAQAIRARVIDLCVEGE